MKTTHIILLLFAIISVSCNSLWESERQIAVSPPLEEYPWESWGQLNGIFYVWSAGAGVRSKQLGCGESLNLTVPRGQSVIILAYPVYKAGTGRYPASVYFSADQGAEQKGRCCFETAPLDKAIIDATVNGCPLNLINYEKWKEHYLDEIPDNPWMLISPVLAEDLTAGIANSHSLKFQETVQVQLSELPSGLFIPENPFLSCWFVDFDGTAVLDLYPGFHRFLIAGTSDMLLITVSDQGEPVWFLEDYSEIELQAESIY